MLPAEWVVAGVELLRVGLKQHDFARLIAACFLHSMTAAPILV